MVLVLEPPAKQTPLPVVPRPRKRNRSWIDLTLLAGALIVASLYLFNTCLDGEAYQLEFSVTSDIPFQEETPRTAHLIIVNPDQTVEILEDNRFASAFLDRRNSFHFSVQNPPPRRIFFSPAPPDRYVEITGVRALDVAGNKVIPISLDNLVPHRLVEVATRSPSSLVVKTLVGPEAPTLELRTTPVFDSSVRWSRLLFTLILPGLAFIGAMTLLLRLYLRTRPFLNSLGALLPSSVAQFGAATALVLTMAVITKFNTHPDEYLHFEAAKYFVTHWFPAATLDDPALKPSFSHYGFSYLQELDAAYFAIGKLMSFVPSWLIAPETVARLFNVLLFTILTAWLLRRLPGSLAPAVLLISPQIWYVFSYVNSDAWALMLSFIMMVQLADKDSLFNEYLRTDDWQRGRRGLLCFATLLALLLMAKKNYYLFLPFIGLVAFWQTFLSETNRPPSRWVKKWAVIVIAAIIIYFPFRIGQEMINGFHRTEIRVEQAEKFAASGFKPSQIGTNSGAQRLNLRQQGVSYIDLFLEHDPEGPRPISWARQSFQSFCGVYRWMNLSGPSTYYFVMGALYLMLLGFLLRDICRLSWRDASFAFGVLGLIVFIVLASAYQSWTADFQPQGRYLFPILPMIAFLFHRYEQALRSRVFNVLLSCLFAGSVYSFVFIGLRNIPK